MENVNKKTINVLLSKAVSFNEKEYREIQMDLESLTGKDVIEAEMEARMAGDRAVMLEASKTYQVALAAKATGLSMENLKSLSARDFSQITGEVQAFLLG